MKREKPDDPTVSNRKTTVFGLHSAPATEYFGVEAMKKFPSYAGPEFLHGEWVVVVKTVTGLDDPASDILVFQDENSAKQYMADNPVGSDQSNGPFPKDFDCMEWYKKAGNLPFPEFDSDDFAMPCYSALSDAGIIDPVNFSINADLLEGVSSEKLNWLKKTFGDSWEIVLEAEYVIRHYPMNSLAGYAIQIFYHLFVLGNEITSGYLWREMKMVLSGAEEIAIQEKSTREKAGRGGGKASGGRKSKRLNSFIVEIEKLAPFYPRISEARLLDQAFDNAQQSDESLWSEGKDQKENYLSNHIRSEEPYKSRYYAIFGKTT